MPRGKSIPLALLLAAACPAAKGAVVSGDLFNAFAPGWRDHWREERFFTRPTVYDTVEESGTTVLHATSHAAHGGLVREVNLPHPHAARLHWRWKVAAPLSANREERTRAGDDYAVRVFVIFETSVIPLRTRAINYVWAAHEPIGSTFPSPYTRNVGMIVLRSGVSEAGQWCHEARDLSRDYERFFGRAPTRISAVAVLVDTDNTGLSAEAWLADLRVEHATNRPSDPERP
jgi:hypothetical protein